MRRTKGVKRISTAQWRAVVANRPKSARMNAAGLAQQRLERMSIPEVLLPVQQWPHRPATPEVALVIAVLADAVECLRKYRGAAYGYQRRLWRDAEEWFSSEQPGWPFSFENVCAFLRLDPQSVRQSLGVHASTARPEVEYA